VYLNRNNPVYTQPIMIPLRLLLAIPLLAAALPAQQARWSKIDPNSPVPHTGDATLTPAQIHSIHTLFHADGQLRRPDCAASDPDHGLPTDWFKHLAYTTLARSHSSETILAEDTTNCGSPGGTSGAAPIWVIHLASVRTAIHATLLASPLIDQHVGGISGWLYRILPANSPVYPDLVLGWHMSAAETTSPGSTSTAAATVRYPPQKPSSPTTAARPSHPTRSRNRTRPQHPKPQSGKPPTVRAAMYTAPNPMRMLSTFLTLVLIPAAALAQHDPAPGTSLPTFVAGNEQFSRKLLAEAHRADPTHNIVLTPLPLTLFLTAVQIESWNRVTTDELAGPFGWGPNRSVLYGAAPMLLAAFREPSSQDLAEIRKRLAAGDHPSLESTWLESTLLYPASHTPESLLNPRFLHTARQVFAIHLQSTPTSPRTPPNEPIHLTLRSHMHVQMVWAGNTFSMSKPFPSTFQPQSGPSTPAEMQTSELSQYPYARTDDFEAAVLPCYNGTMTVILPLPGKTISQIEQSLAANPKLLDSPRAAIADDPRWQLVLRIAESHSLGKSPRLAEFHHPIHPPDSNPRSQARA
jgi:hypothetical protein